jgi:hypothetical protein
VECGERSKMRMECKIRGPECRVQVLFRVVLVRCNQIKENLVQFFQSEIFFDRCCSALFCYGGYDFIV